MLSAASGDNDANNALRKSVLDILFGKRQSCLHVTVYRGQIKMASRLSPTLSLKRWKSIRCCQRR